MSTLYSYDFSKPKQDIQGAFDDLIVKNPTLLSRFGTINGTNLGRKHEWFERSLSQRTTTITGFDGSDGDGTKIAVASTDGISVYDVLYFKGDGGEYKSEKVQVTGISGLVLTITRDYGGSTGVTLEVNDIVTISEQISESATYSADSITQPTSFYNVTKIYDKALELTTLSMIQPVNGKVYGHDAVKVFDWIKQLELEIMWAQIDDFINGVRVDPANTTTAKGLCGGFAYYTSGGITETTGGAISLAHFNNINESLMSAGAGASTRRIFVMHPTQARKVSALGIGGTNPITFRNEGSTITGSYIATLQGDLPGNVNEIVVAEQMPTDQIYVIDPSLIKMVIQKPLTDTDATDKSVSALLYARRLVTAITWEIKNGKTSHGIISGLDT